MRLQGRHNQQNISYKPCIHRGWGHRNYPHHERGMREVEEILDKGQMTETEEDILHSEADPKVTIIQEGHTEDKTVIEIDVTIDSKCPEVRVASRSQGRDKEKCFSCRQVGHFAKEGPEMDTSSSKM